MPKDSWFKRTFTRYLPRERQWRLADGKWDNTELENQFFALKHRALSLGLEDMAKQIDAYMGLMSNLRDAAGHKWIRTREKFRAYRNIVGYKVKDPEKGEWTTDDEGDVIYKDGAFGDFYVRLKKTVKHLEERQDRNNVEAMLGRYLSGALRINNGPYGGPGSGPYGSGPAGPYGPPPGPLNPPPPPQGPQTDPYYQGPAPYNGPYYGPWPTPGDPGAQAYGDPAAYYAQPHGYYGPPMPTMPAGPAQGSMGMWHPAMAHWGAYMAQMAAWMRDNPDQANAMVDAWQTMYGQAPSATAPAPDPGAPTPDPASAAPTAVPTPPRMWMRPPAATGPRP